MLISPILLEEFNIYMETKQQSKFSLYSLEELIKNIYINHPLFGYVLINLDRNVGLYKDIPTACLSHDKLHNNYSLYFNSDFMSTLTIDEQKAVIIHEVFHMILQHHSRFSEEIGSNKYAHHITNIAMDCSINQIITDKMKLPMPDKTVTLKMVREMAEDDSIKPHETAEYYFNKLIQNNKIANNIKFYKDILDFIDNHKQLDKLSQEAQNYIRQAIDKQQQHEMRKGTEPGDSLLDIVKKSEKVIDKRVWKNLINKCFTDKLSNNFYNKFDWPSRRYKGAFYGKKRKLEGGRVWVIIDTSGSTAPYIDRFVNQINAALRQCSLVVDLVECDAVVTNVIMGLKQIKNNFQLHGGGGTHLVEAIDYIQENDKSQKKRIVVLTDGYTDWKTYPGMNVTVLYTYEHAKLNPINYSAVIPL